MNSQNSKHMKMNARYIVAMFFGAMAAACTVSDLTPETGVSEEISEGAGQVAEGMRVVDYAVSEGAQTKALGEGLSASERISSLIYLLYDASGALVKERVIPDIGSDTQWPLKRPDADGQGGNMTWAQREALKDTLAAGQSFTAVFVANADPELFGLDGSADDRTVLHYKEFSQSSGSASGPYYGLAEGQYSSECTYLPLSEIYLSLPPGAFSDANMFYLDVVEIPAGTGGADGSASSAGAVTDAPVMLERIVSRTDIRRINSGENGTDPVDYSADDVMRENFLESLVRDDLYIQIKSGIISEVQSQLEEIGAKFSDKVFEEYYDLALSSDYAGYGRTDLASEDAAAKVLDSVKEDQIIAPLLQKCVADNALKNRLQSWNEQSVVLEVSNLAAKYLIGFADGTDSSAGAKPETETPVYRTYGADASGVISIAGFGDGTSLNELNSISLVGSDGGNLSFDGLSGFYLWHGENKMNEGICNPVSALKFSDTSNTEQVTLYCDLMELFGNEDFSSSWDGRFEAVLDEVILKNNYGGSFSSAVLTVSIPACDNNLTATASIQ